MKYYINRLSIQLSKSFKLLESCRLKYGFLFFFFLLIISCKNQFNAPISEEKLIKILVDVHTAEGVTQAENQNIRDSITAIYYMQIFEHHGITRKDFDSTMAIYARNPVQFDSVFARAEHIVKAKRDSLLTR